MKITPVAYDNNSRYSPNLLDGDNFTVSTPFLILSSQAIPKTNARFYFEVTITSMEKNTIYRYLPIYLGVHKEPSTGVLGNDFCLGSIYYTRRQEIETFENYRANGYSKHYIVDSTNARTPIINTVLGIGVDMISNTITIYSDGKEYYSFSPEEFNMMNEQGDFYFAICSRVYANMSGYINFGKYRTLYKPDGYWDLYQWFQDRYLYQQDIYGFIKYSSGNQNTDDYYDKRIKIGFDFNGNITTENELADLTTPHYRKLYVITNESNYKNEDKNQYYINPKNDTDEIDTDINKDTGEIARLCYPIPLETPIYFEITVKEAKLSDDVLGIPVSIGLMTNDERATFKINLWHDIYHKFKVITQYYNKQNMWDVYGGVYNPTEPAEPDVIGILINLKEQLIQIYTDNKLFMEARLSDYIVLGRDDSGTQQKDAFTDDEKKLINFNTPYDIIYAFIQSDYHTISERGYVICNFGDPNTDPDKLEYTIPNGAMSYWYYYNWSIRELAHTDMECVLSVLSNHVSVAKSFTASLYVKYSEDSIPLGFTPGMNMMWDTYNVITDDEDYHNIPDRSIFDIKKDIDGDNYIHDIQKYFKDIIFGNILEYIEAKGSYDLLSGSVQPFIYTIIKNLSGTLTTKNQLWNDTASNNGDLFKGTFTYLQSPVAEYGSIIGKFYQEATYYTITIVQTPHQTITVTDDNDNKYTATTKIPYNTHLTVTVTPDEGYNAGYPNPKEFIVDGNQTVTASNANIKVFTVTLITTDHQTIHVNADGVIKASTFIANWGTNWTATLVPDEGYNPGTLNITSGVIKSDITIRATAPAIIKTFTITIIQSDHQLITVSYSGKNYNQSFTATYGSYITASIITTESGGWTTGNLNITRIDKLTANTTIQATAAVQWFTITIVQSAHQTITVTANGKNYTSSVALPAGTYWTASITAEAGYSPGTLSSTGGGG